MHKQLNLVPIRLIISYLCMVLMGLRGGWVWAGDGWVSIDRRLLRRCGVWWLWICRVWKHLILIFFIQAEPYIGITPGCAASESGVTSPELLIMFPYGNLERF